VPRPHRKRSDRRQTPPDPASGPTDTEHAETPSQRLDKWLWFARFARTRSLAARLVEAGKIRVNREKILKPAHTVRLGDVITAAVGGRVRVVRVALPGERRGPADEARGLYEDLTPPSETAEATASSSAPSSGRAAGSGRPTKRERRQLDAARQHASEMDER